MPFSRETNVFFDLKSKTRSKSGFSAQFTELSKHIGNKNLYAMDG